MTIPTRSRNNAEGFIADAQRTVRGRERGPERACVRECELLTKAQQRLVLPKLEAATEHVPSPMQRLEHNLHPWVAFLVVPLFALANAGVVLRGDPADALTGSITLGVVAGLIIAKQVGFAWLMVRTGLTTLPDGVTMRQVHGASCLAGIGFTMSLFIADRAFLDPDRLADSKLGILMASLLAGLIGWCMLRLASRPGHVFTAQRLRQIG